MKILFTPSHYGSVLGRHDWEVDQTTLLPVLPEQICHLNQDKDAVRSAHRPFGISWDRDTILVTNRKYLLAFDHNLVFQNVLTKRLSPNPHQIIFHEKKVWITTPRLDCLTCYFEGNLSHHDHRTGQKINPPLFQGTSHDVHHINSILFADGKRYVMEHNRGIRESRIICDGKILDFQIGMRCHGIAVKDGSIYSIDTHGKRIVRNDGLFSFITEQDHFCRGLCVTDEFVFVGHFPSQPEAFRGFGDAFITRFTLELEKIDTHVLKACGAINDMRVIDEFDYAHQQSPLESKPARAFDETGKIWASDRMCDLKSHPNRRSVDHCY